MAKWILALLALGLAGCLPATAEGPEAASSALDCSGSELGARDLRRPPASALIFAGQSNMSGMGQRDEALAAPIPNVVVWAGDHWETYQPGRCFGPDLAFAQSWNRDRAESVGIVKYAVAGTSMERWTGDLFDNLVSAYEQAGVPAAAVIWAQGESDALDADLSAMYETRMHRFLVGLRNEVGQVPFVFAQTRFPSAPYIDRIRQAQARLIGWERVCMTGTDDLTTWPDDLHFDTEGQLELGRRLYESWTAC